MPLRRRRPLKLSSSYRNSSYSSLPPIIPVVLCVVMAGHVINMQRLNEQQRNELKNAMASATSVDAVKNGIRPELSKYFKVCQQENGITPGDRNNITYDKASAAEKCLWNKQEEAEHSSMLLPVRRVAVSADEISFTTFG